MTSSGWPSRAGPSRERTSPRTVWLALLSRPTQQGWPRPSSGGKSTPVISTSVAAPWELVTAHFLHPPDTGMVDVTRRLAAAVGPGGHLLVVKHAPNALFTQIHAAQRRAMWLAEDLRPALPVDLELLIL